MNSPVMIRPATQADLPAINAIYNHYVAASTCTYQTEPSTDAERLAWFCEHRREHPILVAQVPHGPGEVLGWASLSRFHARCAYRHTVEDSVYIHPACQGRGIGRTLLADLIARAGQIGHHSIVALISADQAPSLALHAALGFVEVGRLRQVGYKFDRWLDVAYCQLML